MRVRARRQSKGPLRSSKEHLCRTLNYLLAFCSSDGSHVRINEGLCSLFPQAFVPSSLGVFCTLVSWLGHRTASRNGLRKELTLRPQSEMNFTFWRRIRQRTTLPWGLFPFDVSNASSDQHRGSIPDYAAPSGFLILLTLFSAHAAPALFHADSALGFSAFRGFSLPVATTAFAARCPSCRSSHDAASGIDASGRFVHEGAVLPGPLRPILSER